MCNIITAVSDEKASGMRFELNKMFVYKSHSVLGTKTNDHHHHRFLGIFFFEETNSFILRKKIVYMFFTFFNFLESNFNELLNLNAKWVGISFEYA